MLDILLGAGGGVFGILGALFKHGIEVWQEQKKADASLALVKEQNSHELAMADKQAALIKLEADNALTLAEVNRQKETDVAAYGALSASFDADKATYSDAPTSPWMIAVDVARGLTRPALTWIFSIALIAFTCWLWVKVPSDVTKSPEFMNATFYRLIDALIFLATSAVGWWFAMRGSANKQ